jgi:hypothetical protein
VYRLTLLSILLLLLSPRLAYANGMAALIYVPIMLQLASYYLGLLPPSARLDSGDLLPWTKTEFH